jgi:ABC-type nitrate/sulfonate/bicarbonate transport system substrate-binding protein
MKSASTVSRKLIIMAVATAAVAIVLIVLASCGRPAANNTITLGSVGTTSDSALIYCYGQEKGIFEKHGLKVTYAPFNDAYTKNVAFFSGRLDVASSSPAHAAAAYGDGERFKVGIVNGEASHLMLLVKPGISRASDLAGKRIGVMGRNSDSYQLVKWYLEAQGLDVESESKIVEITNPAGLISGFQANQLDAVVLWTTYALQAMDLGGEILVDCSQALEAVIGCPAYLSLNIFKEEFLDRGEVADEYLRAVRETVQEIRDNREEAARVWAGFCGQPVEVMGAVIDMLNLVGDLDASIQEDLQAYFEYAVEKGYIETVPGEEVYYLDWR